MVRKLGFTRQLSFVENHNEQEQETEPRKDKREPEQGPPVLADTISNNAGGTPSELEMEE
jgi:hypothetical protein